MKTLPFAKPAIGPEEIDAARAVLESGWITTGEKSRDLERALARYIGGGVEVRVFNSATSALEASLLASEIGPGDEVIVPAMSFVASAHAVVRAGARPVFVDVDLERRNLDTAAVEAALTPRARAVIPVHFAGLAVDMGSLYDLAKERDLVVIEDAAQAIGTMYRGRRIGSSGNPACFSFHPNKNMTTIEGGAIASADEEFIEKIERFRFHGIERDADGREEVRAWGGKMNMPDVGAAIGLVQLEKLDGFNRVRSERAIQYLRELPRSPMLVRPVDDDGHSWHMFSVCIDHDALGTTRKDIQSRLRESGIVTGTHYPAIHLFDMYRRLGYGDGDFPVAERIGSQTLTLPLFPAMEEADVTRVCVALEDLLS